MSSSNAWYLISQRGPNTGSAYPLHSSVIAIGRDSDNHIMIDDPQVSRHHARITWQGNAFKLEDLGSANGTWVNNTRIASPVLLRPGDTISLGQNVLLTLSDRPRATTSVAQYGAAYPASVAAPPPPARTNWGWAVVGLGGLALVAALAILALVLFANKKAESSQDLSATLTVQAHLVLVPTATLYLIDTATPIVPPTYTPYPTYTPLPTQLPTHTPIPTQPPTYTPYPTYTPIPTQPPTYTPYPTYTPIPTQPPTYTPYPTYTPFPTPKPTRKPPPKPQATDTPPPTKAPPPPFTVAINKIAPEPWGRPTHSDGCNGPYNDRDPVKRFTIEIVLTNNSNRYIPDGWYPIFYTAQGRVPPTCIWYYNNTAVEPGETIYVTFATHVELSDWVSAMVLDELGYEARICFNAAGQVVSCR